MGVNRETGITFGDPTGGGFNHEAPGAWRALVFGFFPRVEASFALALKQKTPLSRGFMIGGETGIRTLDTL